MIKNLTLTLALAVLFLMGGTRAYASHFMGADITYQCMGGNQYKVILTFYRDCSGIDPGTSLPLVVSSSCGGNQTINLTKDAALSNIEVSQVCSSMSTKCTGGTLPGVKMYTYTGLVTVQPGCGVYTFSHTDCCRNTSNNIVGAINEGYRVQATLNSNLVGCSNSPVFSSLPVPYFCVNQANTLYSHGAMDPDGDSLVYSLITPLNDVGGNVSFTSGFSASNPMPTASGFNFDTQTGQMVFTPSNIGSYVVAVLVSVYHNGVLIGTTMRDIQMNIVNCNNGAPNVNSCLTTSNVSGGTVHSCNYLGVCPGAPLHFTIGAKDPDGQAITVTSNVAQAIPGATLSTTPVGTDSVTVNFSWSPLGTDTGLRYITISFSDNACPSPGVQTVSYSISILKGLTVGPDRYYCPDGGNIEVHATGGNHFSWTPTTGMVSANPDSAIVFFAPDTTTTYYVTSDLIGGCKNLDTITISRVPTFSITPQVANSPICVNQSTVISVSTNPAQGQYTYAWTPTAAGIQSPASSSSIVRPNTTTTYYVKVVSDSGCVVTDSVKVNVDGFGPRVSVTPSANYVCPGTTIQLNSEIVAIQTGPSHDPSNACPDCDFPFPFPQIGTSTTSSGTSTPFRSLWHDGRTQYLYLASEMQAAGMSPGVITDIQFYVTSKGSGTTPFSNFTIKIGGTNLTQLPNGNFVTQDMYTVHSSSYTTVANSWNSIPLDIPFNWDGISNIVVEACFDNTGYTSTDNVQSSTVFQQAAHYSYNDNASGCSLAWQYTTNVRPNIRFVYGVLPDKDLSLLWTPSQGLNDDTIPNPFATIYRDIEYKLTVDDGTCIGDTVVRIMIDTGVGISVVEDMIVCNNETAKLYAGVLNNTAATCRDNYSLMQAPYNYIASSNKTDVPFPTASTQHNRNAVVYLPFKFNFYCHDYDSIVVNENGFITFSAFTGAGTVPVAMPAGGTPNNTIAGLWCDLNANPNGGGSGNISYFVDGSYPYRTFVIEWEGVLAQGQSSTASFQIQLFETTNNIEVHVEPLSFSGSKVIGVENSSGAKGLGATGRNNANFTITTAEAWRFMPDITGTNLIAFQWRPANTLSAEFGDTVYANPNGKTTYYVTALFSNGCMTEDSVVVDTRIFSYTLSASKDSFCVGETSTITFDGDISTIAWTPENVVSDVNGTVITASPKVSTDLVVNAVDKSGCDIVDTVHLYVAPNPTVDLGHDTTLCDCDAHVVLDSRNIDETSTFLWNTKETTSSVVVATSGTYGVEVTSKYGCVSYDSVVVDIRCLSVNASVEKDEIIKGQSTTLSAEELSYEGDFTFNWHPEEFLTETSNSVTSTQPDSSITYWITVRDEMLDCEASDSVRITVHLPGLYTFPNSFTPNGDGRNDRFAPYLPEGSSAVLPYLRVYNRWGQLMYECKDCDFSRQDVGWDGTYNGVPQPASTYLFIAEIKVPNSEDASKLDTKYIQNSLTLIK